MRPKRQNRTCPDAMSNECVQWQGGDVPFLDIFNNDELSIAEKKIADKIVELFGDLDLSTVDITCVQDSCQQKCEDRSIKAIIQLLFDNQCCLRDLINAASGSSSLAQVNLNMKCLRKLDDFGNEVPQDLNQSLQSIINQVCTNTTDIVTIKNEITSLQAQVDAIPITPATPPEAQVTTCLTPGLRAVSQALPLVASAVCDLQTMIGDDAAISQALSQQCQNLNSQYQSVSGWELVVDNIAKSLNNLWIVTCNLKSRIELIEQNCCAVTCDDVKVGFTVTMNDTGTALILKFTSGAGTAIPTGFTDCGSTVTITDKNNTSVTYNIPVANAFTSDDLDVTGLDLSDFLTINLNSKLCATGITCEKCITRLFKPSNAACPFCEIVVTGDPGSSVTIIYQDF